MNLNKTTFCWFLIMVFDRSFLNASGCKVGEYYTRGYKTSFHFRTQKFGRLFHLKLMVPVLFIEIYYNSLNSVLSIGRAYLYYLIYYLVFISKYFRQSSIFKISVKVQLQTTTSISGTSCTYNCIPYIRNSGLNKS